MLFSVFSFNRARPPPQGEGIVAPPRPSPLPAGEGIKGRGKGGEKRGSDFHDSWCPEGAWVFVVGKHSRDKSSGKYALTEKVTDRRQADYSFFEQPFGNGCSSYHATH